MISVCVATYNGQYYLAEQLASILQSPLVDEVVISDDGSSDGTRALIARCEDPRVRLVEGPRAGVVRNFESLLSQAKGDQIFLADQDDVWRPEKVETMVDALRTSDLALSDCTVVDQRLNVLHISFFALRSSRPGLARNLIRNGYVGCCIAFNRSLLTYALPFPKSLPMHDWWLGLVAESFGTVCFVPAPLVLYRRHGENVSDTSGRSRATPWRRLAWRATLVAHLAIRWLSLRFYRSSSHVRP